MILNRAAIFLFICLISISSLIAQVSLSHQSIGGLGSSFSNQNIQINSSVGLPFSKTLSAGNIILTQGFQQPTACVFLVNSGNDTLRACGDSVLITADTGFAIYNWSTGSTTYQTYAKQSGWYSCSASGNCSATDSVFVILLNANIVENDTSTCNVGFLTLHLSSNANSNGTSILWSEGGTGTSAQINLNPVVAPVPDNGDDPNDIINVPVITYPYTKKVWVRLSNGPLVCTDTLRIVIYQPGVLNLSDSVLLVNGQIATIKGDSGFANYSWSNGTFTKNTTSNQNGLLRLNAWNGSGCVSSDSIRIIVLPGIAQDTIKACGDSIIINAGNNQAAVVWNTNQTSNSIYAKSTGWYKCTYSLGALSNSDSVFVSLVKAKIYASSTRICKGGSVTLSADSFSVLAPTQNGLPSFLNNGLVAYYPFDNNCNDLSGNGNDGNLNGATIVNDRFGRQQEAYYFDGINDRIEVSHNSTLNFRNVTVSVWFNTNGYLSSNGFGPHLISKREISGWGNSIQMNVGMHNGQNACWADWNINGNGGIYYGNSTKLKVNNWNHLVYIHDSNSVKLYLNGELVQSIASPGLLGFNSLPMWLGARPNAGNNSQWYNGVMDDICIWNRALTIMELEQLGEINSNAYLWSNNSKLSSITVTPTQTTTYSLRVSNGISYCDGSITIVVDDPPVSNLPDTIKFCGDSVLLNPGTFASYSWNTGSNNQSIYAKSTGWYKVQLTNSNSCSATDSVFVSIVKSKILASSTRICRGTSVTLSAESNSNVIYNNNSINQTFRAGLIGFWPFSGNANDVSNNGNNGIVSGAVMTTDRLNNTNSAYNFTYNNWTPGQPKDEIYVPYNSSFNTNSLTVSAWINPANISFNNGQAYIIARFENGYSNPNGQTWAMAMDQSNRILTGVNNAATTNSQTNSVVFGNQVILNNWVHVVFTYDGTSLKLFQNGSLVSTQSPVIPINTLSSSGLSIGVSRQANGWWFPFDGKIDDVGLWNRALTNLEVQQLYNNNTNLFSWSNNSISSSIIVTPTQTTTYALRVSNGVSYCDDSITIVVDSIIPTNLPDTLYICGDSVLVNAGVYSSYAWSNGSTAASTYIKQSGWNYVTVTNGLSCSLKDSVFAIFTSQPQASIIAGSSTNICQGSSVGLSTTNLAGYTYNWLLNGNSISNQTTNTLAANSGGNYQLIISNGPSCRDTSNTIQVNVQQISSMTLAQLPHQVYLFKGSSNSSLLLASNWLVFDSINKQYSIANSSPQSNAKVIVPSIGSCVLNNPVLSGNFECGDLIIDSLAFVDLSNYKLTVNSRLRTMGLIKSLNGSLTINGLFQVSNIKMDSVQNQLMDFTYNSAGGLITINNALRIKQSINPITGTCLSSGNIILVSDQDGTARILKGTGAYLADSVTVERYLPGSSGRRFRYLSAPFSSGPSFNSSWQKDMHITGPGTGGTVCPNLGANSNGFDVTLTNASSIFTFNETTAQNTNTIGTGGGGTLYLNAWQGIPSAYTNYLQAGKGYRVFYRGNRQQGCSLLNGQNPNPTDAVLKAKGIVQTGSFSFAVTYSPNNGDGWNLLGNPYPCPIDWNSNSGWIKQNLMNQIWIFRPAGNHFANWNGALGIGVNFGHNIIESGSSFFVKATSVNPVLEINENAKVGMSPPVHLFKSKQKILRLLVLKPNEVDDEFALAMLPEALNGQDNFDSEKMSNPWLNIYSINIDGKKNAINSIAPIQSEIEIPLGFGSSYTGLHRFSFKGLEEYDSYDVLLWDKYMGIIHMIHDRHTYEFTFNGGTNTENRFVLILVNRGDPDYLKNRDLVLSKPATSLIISPNPSHEHTSIEAYALKGTNARLIVYNSLGMEISNEINQIKNESILIEKNIETWANGAYEIVLIDELGNRKSGRLIKQ